jgi:prevent-host-death family protein
MSMATTGLRELRQNASDLVRRAERGETVTVTVSGREVAQLGPLQRTRWRAWEEVVGVFQGPVDDDWTADRDLVDQEVKDPFAG